MRFHECNKVELDLLKKTQFHIIAHFLFKLNDLQRCLSWTYEAWCAQAQRIPLHAPSLFSIGNIPRIFSGLLIA